MMILPILRMTASSILRIAQMDLVFRSFTCRITRKRKLTRHWPIPMQISNVNTFWVMVVTLVLQDFQSIVKVVHILFSERIVKILIEYRASHMYLDDFWKVGVASKLVKPHLQNFICFLSIIMANFSKNLVTIASIFPLSMALLD